MQNNVQYYFHFIVLRGALLYEQDNLGHESSHYDYHLILISRRELVSNIWPVYFS